MKKILSLVTILAAVVSLAGEVRNITQGVSIPGATAVTNAFTINGEILGIELYTATGATGTWAIASEGVTILSKTAQTGNTRYRPRLAVQDTAGNAASTNVFVVPFESSGVVTTVVTGVSTTTNTFTTKIIFRE